VSEQAKVWGDTPLKN